MDTNSDPLPLSTETAHLFAREWVEAWNSHDLERILSHYSDDVVVTSPVLASLMSLPSGTIEGKAALRQYFSRGLQAFPNVQFDLRDVLWGINTVVLYYRNQRGSMTAEVMQLDDQGQVVRMWANYNG